MVEEAKTLSRDILGNIMQGLSSLITDIPERERGEESLQEARLELERWIEERAVALSAANERFRSQGAGRS